MNGGRRGRPPASLVHQRDVEEVSAFFRSSSGRLPKGRQPSFDIALPLSRATELVPIARSASVACRKRFEGIQLGLRLLQVGEARCKVAPVKGLKPFKLRCFDEFVPAFLMFPKSAAAKTKIVVRRSSGTRCYCHLISPHGFGVVAACGKTVSKLKPPVVVTRATL